MQSHSSEGKPTIQVGDIVQSNSYFLRNRRFIVVHVDDEWATIVDAKGLRYLEPIDSVKFDGFTAASA